MFDVCLAPSTNGSGVGCDNMSCVIIVLNRCRGGADSTPRLVVHDAGDVASTKRSYVDATGDESDLSSEHAIGNTDKKRLKLDEEDMLTVSAGSTT